ncbi:MAG: Hvo_1808 family surface protein [Halohasta sp.]
MNRPLAFVLALLLLAGGVAPVATASPTTTSAADSLSTPATPAQTVDTAQTTDTAYQTTNTAPQTTDTETENETETGSEDPLGCVDGVCHDDELDFEEPTDLSDDELDALVDRSMARVEYLRGERFDDDVPVEIQSREEFRESDTMRASTGDESFDRWNDQVWEALFIVGEDQRSADAIDGTLGEAVNGFYTASDDRIVIITSSPDSPSVNELTLIHEFTHALQDQRHDLTSEQFRADSQDADLAANGAIEGEAVYIEERYEQRCESGEWECFDEPTSASSGGGDSPTNRGLLYLLLQPYSDGPAYVDEIRDEEGWAGVDDLMTEPPETTSEVIHRRAVEARDLDVENESTDGWQRYPEEGRDGAEVTGEASIYVMFWYQAREYDADTIDPDSFSDTDGEYDRYNYVSDPSEGWVGDELHPYQRGDDDGYVWSTEWETREDAAEFRRAYGAILDAHDANETDAGVYEVSNGSFSGAYAVDTDGTRVTIVHAPTEDGLFELRPSLDPDPVDDPLPFGDSAPGFGLAAALAALLAAAIAGRRLH